MSVQARVYGYTEIEGDLLRKSVFVIKEVCREYIKHLDTHVKSKLPSGEEITLVPDCRHALWCECVHTPFGPLRGRVVRECDSEVHAEAAVRVLTYGE